MTEQRNDKYRTECFQFAAEDDSTEESTSSDSIWYFKFAAEDGDSIEKSTSSDSLGCFQFAAEDADPTEESTSSDSVGFAGCGMATSKAGVAGLVAFRAEWIGVGVVGRGGDSGVL